MMGNNVFCLTVIFVAFFVVSTNQQVIEKWQKYQQNHTEPIQNTKPTQTITLIRNELNISNVTVRDNNSVNRFETNFDNSSENVYINRRRQRKMTYIPFARYDVSRIVNQVERKGEEDTQEEECVPNSSDEFPADLFTTTQKKQGAVVFHFLLGVYCFTLLAVVCNDYFLPSVERICEVLNLSQDVAAATFMAIATSAPEFFVNVIGTFITKSDIGVGTVVGSAMFNTLGVAAVGGLAASKPIQIHWWPLTRDSIIYVVVLIMLVLMCNDGEIQWYEALILLICYILYFILMWTNHKIKKVVKRIARKIIKKVKRNKEGKRIYLSTAEQSSSTTISTIQSVINRAEESRIEIQNTQTTVSDYETDSDKSSFVEEHDMSNYELCHLPKGTWVDIVWFFYSWPIRFILLCTIPNCRKYPNLFPVTFIMCVAWIGSNSYVVSWMITVIGNTFGIPDFVMGLTFLAAGGCLPEAISIVIVCRKGHGGMGVSNSLGANTLDILMCLGLPWFIKVMVNHQEPIYIGSVSLFYTITALLLAVVALYTTLTVARYKLYKKLGVILISIYAVFLTAAILLEILNVDGDQLKPCDTE